ncbi:MAG: hypothetical protein DRO04_01650, partial [Candidatus Iainarchaeum archaeon]
LTPDGNLFIPIALKNLSLTIYDYNGNPFNNVKITLYSLANNAIISSILSDTNYVIINDLYPTRYLLILYYNNNELYRREIDLKLENTIVIKCNIIKVSFIFKGFRRKLKLNVFSQKFREEINISSNIAYLYLPIGEYTVRVFNEEGMVVYSGNLKVTPECTSYSVDLNLQELRIMVRDLLGQPLANAKVVYSMGNYSIIHSTDTNGETIFYDVPKILHNITVFLDNSVINVVKSGNSIVVTVPVIVVGHSIVTVKTLAICMGFTLLIVLTLFLKWKKSRKIII